MIHDELQELIVSVIIENDVDRLLLSEHAAEKLFQEISWNLRGGEARVQSGNRLFGVEVQVVEEWRLYHVCLVEDGTLPKARDFQSP